MVMVIDPVCKMEVDTKSAKAKVEYKGQMYYFCCLGCKEKFEEDPDKYLGKKKGCC